MMDDMSNWRRPISSRLQFIVTLGVIGAISAQCYAIDSLRVMTYNIWVGGRQINNDLSHTVGVIQAAQADVIGIQEVGSSAQAIATALGFHYQGFNSDIAIISRYPIGSVLNQGVRLQISPTQEAYVFDVHLAPYPYQPYDIRDGLVTTESQAIAAAQATRGSSVSTLVSNMSSALASGSPVFLTGDFNEPSHLDWTQEAATAGLHFGMKVNWPTSRSVTNAGLTDAFRELRPDEVLDRGETWTPGAPAPNIIANEVHDRIDFVYYSGLNVSATSAQILGYNLNDGNTDIAIQPYPSDHRAVVVQFSLPHCSLAGDLNGDCSLTAADWMQFRSGQHANLTGLSRNDAYKKGDLNGDFQNNHADFVIFKEAYEIANGTGTFALIVSQVPEPSAFIYVAILTGELLGRPRRRKLVTARARSLDRE
jgi:endonuclease/exonuclease/phosphatase family metal-dependent hydrolase